MRYKEKNSGITLIALVVTVIVLLILAGISLAMLTGPNGLINKATQTGKDSIIGEEKERVAMAYNGALTTKMGGEVTADDIQAELDRNKTEAVASETEKIEIYFLKTNHIYYLEVNGEIIGPTTEERNDEQADIFEYTNDGWITGIKEEFLEDIQEEIGSKKDISIASLGMSNLELAVNGDGTTCKLVNKLNKTLKIPNKIDNVQIIGIDSKAFSSIENLENVEIARGIKEIRDSAFEWCDNLKSVKMPGSILKIGDNAFYNDSKLTSIEIPNNVTSIGKKAFYNCRALTSVEIPNSVTSIGESAFAECSELTNIEIANSEIDIGEKAFENTKWYENLPEGEIYIGKVYYKYKGEMPNNTSISIRDGTKKIVGYAFENCQGLTNINIPNSVTNIGERSFYGCSGLVSIKLSNNITELTRYLFGNCSSLLSIEIPDKVTVIGRSAFSGCSGITNIEIPSSVTQIDNSAFWGCTGLRKIYIPSSVVTIYPIPFWIETPFYGCDSSLKIYCEDESSKSDWGSGWNNYDRYEELLVEYGYTLEQFRAL